MLIFEFSGLQTLAAHEQSLADWNHYFSRNERFVAVRIFHDEDSLVHPDGAAQLTKSWLRNGAAEAIKTSVVAMINIVPTSAYERMKHMSVEAVFGVPGGVFNSVDEAVGWFNSNVSATVGVYLKPDKW